MLTFADGFSGFGGVKIGAIAAGLQPLWSNEKDPEIAKVNQDNFPHDRVIVEDFLTLDPSILPAPDVMHWSPPCINASVAKQADDDGVRESDLDRDFSRQIVRFTEVHQPKIISLENVFGYRNFQAFQGGDACEGLVPALWRLGYHVRWWHLNFADMGVAQTRKRLIMLAARDFIPQRPQATHQDPKEMNGSQMDMFTALNPWQGWYAAIEDLIPTLPASKFAPWQLARLPDTMKNFIINPNGSSIEWSNENDLEKYRAFIAAQGKYDDKLPISTGDKPALTITANSNQTGVKAFISDSLNYNSTNPNRFADEPVMTVTVYSNKHPAPRAWLSHGRVVKMTPRALARFQSFPDWYQLSGKNSLDCKGIGNACPPLGMMKIYKGLVNMV